MSLGELGELELGTTCSLAALRHDEVWHCSVVVGLCSVAVGHLSVAVGLCSVAVGLCSMVSELGRGSCPHGPVGMSPDAALVSKE